MEKLRNQSLCDATKKKYYDTWCLFNDFYIKLDRKPDKWEDRIILFAVALVDAGYKSATVKSYVSGIKSILKSENIPIDDTQIVLRALIRACMARNDRLFIRLPIHRRLLGLLLDWVDDKYAFQPYLSDLYKAMFVTGYYGLMRVGEMTKSPHVIKFLSISRFCL